MGQKDVTKDSFIGVQRPHSSDRSSLEGSGRKWSQRRDAAITSHRGWSHNNLVFSFVPPLSLQPVLLIWPFAQKQKSLKNRKYSLQYTEQKQKK